ncbi:M24 family metallopeptidase [Burkholderia cepacia]|uniref:M24 family metallopeptidase n=1 Tax=Burkholderia cepacia TaxID=292 RepID=UPI002AB70A30|nr:M24 family metallopeptidase [Burkholderia cepacia]
MEETIRGSANPALIARPLPPAPDVPAEDLADRLKRVREEMDKAHLDVIVLSDRKNIEYFTGFQTLSWFYKARPVLGLVTAKDIFVVASKGEATLIGLKPRNFTPKYFDGYLVDAVALLSETIRSSTSGTQPRIGLDYGQDMVGFGSLELVDALRDLSANGKLQSAAPTLWKVRLIKSAFEAGLKRTAFSIVNNAFDSTIKHAYIGMPEYELSQLMQAQSFLNGADSVDPTPLIFSKGDFAYGRAAGDRKLEEGHYVWTDFRATYGGYPADRNRIARAGEPAKWEQDVWSAVLGLTHDLCRSVRPGMTCAELFANYKKSWAELKVGDTWAGVSRIGHGGGLDTTEPPSLSATDQEVIRPGMILHIEPKLERDGAVFQFEEVIHVLDDGVEFLTPLCPEQIPVIR